MLSVWSGADKPAVKESTRLKKLASWRAYYQRNKQKITEVKKRNRGQYHTRKYALKHKYGITVEQYDAMLARQKGKCGLCGKKPKPDKRLAVDHCHRTGKVRGLLCHCCNNGLGCFNDNTDLMLLAVAYVESHA